MQLDAAGQPHQMILDIIGPGHSFGELSLLDPSGKTTYVTFFYVFIHVCSLLFMREGTHTCAHKHSCIASLQMIAVASYFFFFFF